MGNQTSRFDQSSSSTTITDDPCLDNMRQWHTNQNDEPYKRQYPLPTIANDHNRVKPRKQSSPAAVTTVTATNTYSRRPLSRFFSRQNSSSKFLPRNNSYVDSVSLNHYNTLTNATTIAAMPPIKQQQVLNIANNNTTTNKSNTAAETNTTPTTSQPHYVHPLAPPSIDQRSLNQLFPYDNESFSRPSLDNPSRRLNNSSNRNSLNHAQLLILAQQEEEQQEQLYTYRLIGERKYHQVAGSNYLLPCDDEEIDRLHLQHFMIRFAIQG